MNSALFSPPRRRLPAIPFLASILCALSSGCASEGDDKPPTDITTSYPSAEVELAVDDMGITHVYAKSDADAFYGAGYAMARDRLFQMELSRRQALGRKAEIFGEAAKKGDIGARTFNFAKLGQQDEALLRAEKPEDAALIDAWVAGVNKRLEEVRTGEAPRPYGLRESELNFVPEPWMTAHVFAIGKVLGFGLSNSLDAEILGTALLRIVPDTLEKLPVMMPAFDSFMMLPPKGGAPGPGPVPPPPPVPPLPPGVGKAPADIPAFTYQPIMPELASNNWAVAGKHTDTGRPFLAGDPHQALTSPTRLWPVHMSSVDAGGSLDVIGFSFVGTPSVQLGHNAHIGWTATTNFADVMDLWEVQATTASTSVTVGSESRAIEPREEIIRVRSDGAPVGEGEDYAITIQDVPGFGVILPDEMLPVPRALIADGPLLFNWTGFRPTMESAAYIALDRAKDLDAFEAASSILDVGAVNLVAASKDGIDYHVHAAIPDRGTPGSHPMPWHVLSAKDEQSLWTRGDLPADKLPRERDPERGYLSSANNDPFGFTADGSVENDPFYYGSFFANGFRAQRIEDALSELTTAGKVSRAQMEELQRDVKSLMAESLVPHLEKAMADLETDPALAAYKGRQDLIDLAAKLAAWDRRFSREQAAPVIFLGLEWFASKRAFEAALTPTLFDPIATKSPPVVLGWLRNVVNKRFEGAEAFAPDGVSALLLAALDDTSAWLKARFGAHDADFKYQDIHAAVFATDFGGELTAPRIPVDGHGDTVNVSAATFFSMGAPLNELSTHEMGLYRMVIGFGDDGTPEATINFARGTREDPEDPHFDDQDEAWSLATHAPLPFRKADVDARAEDRLVLKPLK
jgi:penicillin amidase